MTDFFQGYFLMAFRASVVILIVLGIRPFLKRFSNRIACFLWLAVLFRLLCPYTVEGPVPAFWQEWEKAANETGSIVQGAVLEADGATVSSDVTKGDFDDNDYLSTNHGSEVAQNQGEARENGEIVQGLDSEQKSGETTQSQVVAWKSGETAQSQDMKQKNSGTTQNQVVKQEGSGTAQNQVVKQEGSGAAQNQVVTQEGSGAAQNQVVTQEGAETLWNQGGVKEHSETKGNYGGAGEKLQAEHGRVYAGIEKSKADIGRWMANSRKWYYGTSGKGLTNVLGVIWLLFAVLLTAWTTVEYLKIWLKLREALPNGEWNGIPVRVSDVPGVPMSFGIMKAKIYLPDNFESGFSDAQRDMILQHEANHVKRHDPFWKLLAILALCIQWWNPFVWLAYFLSAKDMEMACDEEVMNRIGDERRSDYANAILHFSCLQSGIFLPATFGKSNAEMRIKNVLRYKKPSKLVTILLLTAVLVMGGCLVTKPADSKMGGKSTEDSLTEENGNGAETQDQLELYGAQNKNQEGEYLYETNMDITEAWNELWCKETLVQKGLLDQTDSFWNYWNRHYVRWDEDNLRSQYIHAYYGVSLSEDGEVYHYSLILQDYKGEDLYYHMAEPEFHRNDKIETGEQAMLYPTYYAVATDRSALDSLQGEDSKAPRIALGSSYDITAVPLLIDELAGIWKENARGRYEALSKPALALEELMHLGGGKGVCQMDTEDSCLVCYTFADGSKAHYRMTYRKGIWYPTDVDEISEYRIYELKDWIGDSKYIPALGEKRMQELAARDEALKSVTAEKLRNVSEKLEEEPWILLPESILMKGEWEDGQEGDFIILKDFPERDACLYGLYGGEAMVLREGDAVYPFLLYWRNNWQYTPDFYAADFDRDGDTEYAILTHMLLGTEGEMDYVKKDELVILDRVGGQVKVHSFTEDSRRKQLEEAFEWRYGKNAEALQGVVFGYVEELWLVDDQWYYSALGGKEVQGSPIQYDSGMQLRCRVDYDGDGAFWLRDMEVEFGEVGQTEVGAGGSGQTEGGNGQAGIGAQSEEAQEEVISVLRADITQDGVGDVIVISVSLCEEDQNLDWQDRIAKGAGCYVRIYRESDIPADFGVGTKTDHGFLAKSIYTMEVADRYGAENLIYVVSRNEKDYLLTERHALFQDEMVATYRVFSLDENGTELEAEKGDGPFFRTVINLSYDWVSLPVDMMEQYSKKLDAWINGGIPVLVMANGALSGTEMNCYIYGMREYHLNEHYGAWEIWKTMDDSIEWMISPYLASNTPAVSFQGPEKKELRDMEHLRESLENLNLRWLALYEVEHAYDAIYRVKVEQEEGKEIVSSDLTGDLFKEIITVDYAAFQEDSQQPVEISVKYSGQEEVFWSDRLWGPHMGWGMYYHVIYGEDDRHYLLFLRPIENSQGTYYGEFQIFSFDGEGQKVILDERHIDSGEEKLNYSKAKEAYNNALNSYLERSILLVSTWGGELELYDPKTASQRIWR